MKEPKIATPKRSHKPSIQKGTPSRKFLFKQFVDAQSNILSNKYPFLSTSQIHKKATDLWSKLTPEERDVHHASKRVTVSTPKSIQQEKKKIFKSQNSDTFSSPADSLRSFSPTGAEKKYGESSGLHIHGPPPELQKQSYSQSSILKKNSDGKKSKGRVSFSDDNNESKLIDKEEMDVNGVECYNEPSDDNNPYFAMSIQITNSESINNDELDSSCSRDTIGIGQQFGNINLDLNTLSSMTEITRTEGSEQNIVKICDGEEDSISTSVVTPVKLFRNESSPEVSPQLLVANKAVASDVQSNLLGNVYDYFENEVLEQVTPKMKSKKRGRKPKHIPGSCEVLEHKNELKPSVSSPKSTMKNTRERNNIKSSKAVQQKKITSENDNSTSVKIKSLQQNKKTAETSEGSGKVVQISKEKKIAIEKDKNNNISQNTGNKQARKNDKNLKRKVLEEETKNNLTVVKKQRGKPAKQRSVYNNNKCENPEKNDSRIVGKYCLRGSNQKHVEHIQSANPPISVPLLKESDVLGNNIPEKNVAPESLGSINTNEMASGIRKICPLFKINVKDAERLLQLNREVPKPNKGKKLGANVNRKRPKSMSPRKTSPKSFKTVAVVKHKISHMKKTGDIYVFQEDEICNEHVNLAINRNRKSNDNGIHLVCKSKYEDANPTVNISHNEPSSSLRTYSYISNGKSCFSNASMNRKETTESDVFEITSSEQNTPEKMQYHKASKRSKTLSKVKHCRRNNKSRKQVKSDGCSLVSSPNIGSFTVDSSDDSESERCIQLLELNRALQNDIVHEDDTIQSNMKDANNNEGNQLPHGKDNEVEFGKNKTEENCNAFDKSKEGNKSDIRNYFTVVNKNFSHVEEAIDVSTNCSQNNHRERISDTAFKVKEDDYAIVLENLSSEKCNENKDKLIDVGVLAEAPQESCMINYNLQDSEASMIELMGINQSMHNNRLNDIYNTELIPQPVKDSPVYNKNKLEVVNDNCVDGLDKYGRENSACQIYPLTAGSSCGSAAQNQNLPDIVPIDTQNRVSLKENKGHGTLCNVVEPGFKVPDLPLKLKSSVRMETPLNQSGNIKKLITPQTDDNLIKVTMEKVSKAPHKKVVVSNDKSNDDLNKARKARKSLKHIVTSLVNSKTSTNTNTTELDAETRPSKAEKSNNDRRFTREVPTNEETSFSFIDENGNEPNHKIKEFHKHVDSINKIGSRKTSAATSSMSSQSNNSIHNGSDRSEFWEPSFISMIATASLMETASHENLKSLEGMQRKSPEESVYNKSSRLTLDNALRSLRDIASSQSTLALEDIDSVFSHSNSCSPALSGIAEFMEEAVENVINEENDVDMAENATAGLDYSNATLEKALTLEGLPVTSPASYFQNCHNNRGANKSSNNNISTEGQDERPQHCVSRQVAALAHLVSIPEYQRELPHNVNRTLLDLFDEPQKPTQKQVKENKITIQKAGKERNPTQDGEGENFFL